MFYSSFAPFISALTQVYHPTTSTVKYFPDVDFTWSCPLFLLQYLFLSLSWKHRSTGNSSKSWYCSTEDISLAVAREPEIQILTGQRYVKEPFEAWYWAPKIGYIQWINFWKNNCSNLVTNSLAHTEVSRLAPSHLGGLET